MAIYHMSMKPVTRASGRSAVASAAYRAAVRLTNERDGLTHDFTRRDGVEHSEIVLPDGLNAEWARDRSVLWNAAERSENRKDARVAREFEIALPHELTAAERLELTRAFAQDLANRYGAAVDFAVHAPHRESDVRNHHAHLLMTTRTVGPEGLGEKTNIERKNEWLLSRELPTSHMQLRDVRQAWESHANEHMARAGLEMRVDHRSHAERGLEIEPTEHMGVHATQMERRGLAVSRGRLDGDAALHNAELIREKPEQVLSVITNEKSVFDRHDIARALHRYINDDAQAFQSAFASVMASPALMELQPERTNAATGEVELARYSTREVVNLESDMAASADRLHQAQTHGVDRLSVLRAIGRQDEAIRLSVATDTAARVERGELDVNERDRRIEGAGLSHEQRNAIEHITGPERIAAVVGFAGAGKSTMLAAAREAWEAQGYTVHGAALSGKAAEGLEESSGIRSRTLAAWTYGWQNDRRTLGRGDVFVVDEAGMIGSRQLAGFMNEVEKRGAKIVLVGDHEQLQAIGAGAPFRAITEQIGYAELSEIRRQHEPWQREASASFATHRTTEGLAAYREHGDIRFSGTREGARSEIVQDYLADREQRPEGTRVAMAHRRADVRALNSEIRSALQERGELARGADAGELTFQTNDGQRAFAPGDRIVFLQNDRDLGVKNGMLGMVESVAPGRIVAQLDGPREQGGGDRIAVPMDQYNAIDHGYATTIHKNQGATVDRAYVLASATMDRHLTYVAMTRHRDGVQLYAGQDEFFGSSADRMLAQGRLVEHGAAPYQHDPKNGASYFVTLENDKGEKRTTWGVDLGRAMGEAAPRIGDRIGLEHRGAQSVQLPDGSTAERNAWKVHSGDELAYRQLEARLSRSGAKETTLDYTRDFAERRGIAEQLGVRSEIEVPSEGLLGSSQKMGGDFGWENHAADLATARGEKPRRNPFEGLKLGRGAPAEKPQQDRASAPDRQDGQKQPQEVEKPRRSMFAGLKLSAGSTSSQDLAERPERERASVTPEGPKHDRLAEGMRRPSPLEAAVDRYARAYHSVEQHTREGLPVLDMQRQAMREAGEQLDQVRPGMHDLMRSTLQYDPQTVRAMTELAGRERVAQVVEGLNREDAARQNPDVRAERFVERWQDLQSQRQELCGWQHEDARAQVEGQMNVLAKSLERDPQVESILRSRGQELGLGRNVQQSQQLARELEQSLTRGRSQGLER